MAKSSDPAEMQKLSERMVLLNRQFRGLFERCFERPDLAYEKWVRSALNEAHSYELLKNHLFSLGEMPRDERRKEAAIDASLLIADVFKEYRGLRDKLDELHSANPTRFADMQQQLKADPEPWWVKPRTETPASGGREIDIEVERFWLRDR